MRYVNYSSYREVAVLYNQYLIGQALSKEHLKIAHRGCFNSIFLPKRFVYGLFRKRKTEHVYYQDSTNSVHNATYQKCSKLFLCTPTIFPASACALYLSLSPPSATLPTFCELYAFAFSLVLQQVIILFLIRELLYVKGATKLYPSTIFVSAIKIGGNPILNCHFSKQIYTLAHQTTQVHMEN